MASKWRGQTALADVLVFLPSLVFGWASDRYRQLFPCVLLHGFYNAGYLIFLQP